MKKGRFTEEQIIGILKQHEARRQVPGLAREIGPDAATIYTWNPSHHTPHPIQWLRRAADD